MIEPQHQNVYSLKRNISKTSIDSRNKDNFGDAAAQIIYMFESRDVFQKMNLKDLQTKFGIAYIGNYVKQLRSSLNLLDQPDKAIYCCTFTTLLIPYALTIPNYHDDTELVVSPPDMDVVLLLLVYKSRTC